MITFHLMRPAKLNGHTLSKWRLVRRTYFAVDVEYDTIATMSNDQARELADAVVTNLITGIEIDDNPFDFYEKCTCPHCTGCK